jgi:hypothetical protein
MPKFDPQNFLTATPAKSKSLFNILQAPLGGSRLVIVTCTPLRSMLGGKPRNFAGGGALAVSVVVAAQNIVLSCPLTIARQEPCF